MYRFTKDTRPLKPHGVLHHATEHFKSDGTVSCRNCSIHGIPKKSGTMMVSEDNSIFCLHCYRIIERLMN